MNFKNPQMINIDPFQLTPIWEDKKKDLLHLKSLFLSGQEQQNNHNPLLCPPDWEILKGVYTLQLHSMISVQLHIHAKFFNIVKVLYYFAVLWMESPHFFPWWHLLQAWNTD